MTKKCTAPECVNDHYSRGYCRPHYKRLLKGDLRLDEPIGSCTAARSERAAAKIRGKKFGPRPKAWGEAISRAKRGRPNGLEGRAMSAATKAKIGAANSGERNGVWRGDDVGYVALHERARKVIGCACEHCGATERPEAALKRAAVGPMKVWKMMIGGKVRNLTYSVNLADYFCLCRPCHKKYDTAK
jgi:hypothetical protein